MKAPTLTEEWREYYSEKLTQLREGLEKARQERTQHLEQLKTQLAMVDGATQAVIQILEQQIAEVEEILCE